MSQSTRASLHPYGLPPFRSKKCRSEPSLYGTSSLETIRQIQIKIDSGELKVLTQKGTPYKERTRRSKLKFLGSLVDLSLVSSFSQSALMSYISQSVKQRVVNRQARSKMLPWCLALVRALASGQV